MYHGSLSAELEGNYCGVESFFGLHDQSAASFLLFHGRLLADLQGSYIIVRCRHLTPSFNVQSPDFPSLFHGDLSAS